MTSLLSVLCACVKIMLLNLFKILFERTDSYSTFFVFALPVPRNINILGNESTLKLEQVLFCIADCRHKVAQLQID